MVVGGTGQPPEEEVGGHQLDSSLLTTASEQGEMQRREQSPFSSVSDSYSFYPDPVPAKIHKPDPDPSCSLQYLGLI